MFKEDCYMRKIIKLGLKGLKIYAICDVLCLAFIGASNLLEQYGKGKPMLEANEDELDNSISRFKKYFNG